MKKYIVEYKEDITDEAINEIKELLDVSYVDQMMNYLFVNIKNSLELKYLDTLDGIVIYEESGTLNLQPVLD